MAKDDQQNDQQFGQQEDDDMDMNDLQDSEDAQRTLSDSQ